MTHEEREQLKAAAEILETAYELPAGFALGRDVFVSTDQRATAFMLGVFKGFQAILLALTAAERDRDAATDEAEKFCAEVNRRRGEMAVAREALTEAGVVADDDGITLSMSERVRRLQAERDALKYKLAKAEERWARDVKEYGKDSWFIGPFVVTLRDGKLTWRRQFTIRPQEGTVSDG